MFKGKPDPIIGLRIINPIKALLPEFDLYNIS